MSTKIESIPETGGNALGDEAHTGEKTDLGRPFEKEDDWRARKFVLHSERDVSRHEETPSVSFPRPVPVPELHSG